MARTRAIKVTTHRRLQLRAAITKAHELEIHRDGLVQSIGFPHNELLDKPISAARACLADLVSIEAAAAVWD